MSSNNYPKMLAEAEARIAMLKEEYDTTPKPARDEICRVCDQRHLDGFGSWKGRYCWLANRSDK